MWNGTGGLRGLSKSQTKQPEFVVAAYRSCGACPVAHLLLLYNRFITWLRVKSVSLPPGEQRAQSSEDLDADCTGLMKSKSLTLSQTLEALRCIIAADRESNRLREGMRMWHRTYLSHKREEKRRGAQWDVHRVINVSGSGDFFVVVQLYMWLFCCHLKAGKDSKFICHTLILYTKKKLCEENKIN